MVRPRQLHASNLDPYAKFAAKAAAGEKLMAIAHSDIRPPTYASFKESASYLLSQHGVEREIVDIDGPRETMKLTSKAQLNGLSVLGFAGAGPKDHCDHLYSFGEVLLPQLEARWAR